MINMDAKSVVISSKCLQGFFACDKESVCHPEFSSGSSDVVEILKQVQNDGVGLQNCWLMDCHKFALQIFAMTVARHYESRNNVSDVVIQKKSFYVRRTVGLWIVTALTTFEPRYDILEIARTIINLFTNNSCAFLDNFHCFNSSFNIQVLHYVHCCWCNFVYNIIFWND